MGTTHMKTWKKSLLVVVGTVIAVMGTFSLVRAAEQGLDFSWLSTSENGIRIGTPGTGDPPEENTLEFMSAEGENAQGTISLSEGGAITANNQFMSVVSGVTETEGEGEGGGPVQMQSGLILSDGPMIETLSAGLITQAGDAGIATGHIEGEYTFVPHAAVLCTDAGDVIVQLGEPAPESKSAKSAQRPSAQRTAPTVYSTDDMPDIEPNTRIKFTFDPSLFPMPPQRSNFRAAE